MGALRNLMDGRFGKLTALELSGRDSHGRATWKCRCDCGKEVVVAAFNLTSGNTKSCGCMHVRAVVNGVWEINDWPCMTPEHKAWRAMLRRCYDKKASNFCSYGGRGIIVCDRWKTSYENFVSDVGNKPTPTHSLGRIDNNGNYEPQNCRWETPQQQANNRKR